ncbi:PspC domain-containing protein [Ekhidna sp.]|uniref:PspC domain-containing protein n=1 Tax=Ekhidna sp. TaxID=2608089 RepID=UPI003CCBA489
MEMTKRLFRSNDRLLGGVCAGIAEYLGWDPTLVRVAYALITIFGIGSPILIYILLWIIMPPR